MEGAVSWGLLYSSVPHSLERNVTCSWRSCVVGTGGAVPPRNGTFSTTRLTFTTDVSILDCDALHLCDGARPLFCGFKLSF